MSDLRVKARVARVKDPFQPEGKDFTVYGFSIDVVDTGEWLDVSVFSENAYKAVEALKASNEEAEFVLEEGRKFQGVMQYKLVEIVGKYKKGEGKGFGGGGRGGGGGSWDTMPERTAIAGFTIAGRIGGTVDDVIAAGKAITAAIRAEIGTAPAPAASSQPASNGAAAAPANPRDELVQVYGGIGAIRMAFVKEFGEDMWAGVGSMSDEEIGTLLELKKQGVH